MKSLLLLGPVFFATMLSAAQSSPEMVIEHKYDRSKLVAISLSGFTGEVLSTLKYDLEIMGCTNTSPETAQFLISGSNQSAVEGRVVDRVTKATLLARAYSAAVPRRAAHALADEIVQTIMPGERGIAQTKIALKVEKGGISELYLADYDGHNPIAITANRSLVAAPCWVPGRRMLFYTSYQLDDHPDVWSYNLDSGVRSIVARYPGSNISPAPSPDGRKVAMIMSKGGSPDLYVADADGKNLKQLTFTKQDESSPCWSPDGRTICFASKQTGRALLYTIPVTGGAMKRLNTDMPGNLTEPDWSPDGKTIAFTTSAGGFQICTVPAQGGMAQLHVAGEDPSWAPNSRTLIFARRVNGKYILSLLDVPTKRMKNTAQISGNCSQPSWAR